MKKEPRQSHICGWWSTFVCVCRSGSIIIEPFLDCMSNMAAYYVVYLALSVCFTLSKLANRRLEEA